MLFAFNDFDASIQSQINSRKKERQLLPLLYFSCLILLLSQLTQITSEVQQAPYIAVITAVLVAHIFFLPIFLYIMSFIIHSVLKVFGSASSNFQTRLAIFWSLTISSVIILIVSIMKIFTTGFTETILVISSELIIIYIFSRILSFVSCFKDRHLFTLVVTSLYLAPNILIHSR